MEIENENRKMKKKKDPYPLAGLTLLNRPTSSLIPHPHGSFLPSLFIFLLGR